MTRYVNIILSMADSRSDSTKCDKSVLLHEGDVSWCVVVQDTLPVRIEVVQRKLLGRDGDFELSNLQLR